MQKNLKELQQTAFNNLIYGDGFNRTGNVVFKSEDVTQITIRANASQVSAKFKSKSLKDRMLRLKCEMPAMATAENLTGAAAWIDPKLMDGLAVAMVVTIGDYNANNQLCVLLFSAKRVDRFTAKHML